MTKLNCLIVEPSYLIRKGLVGFFKEFRQVGLVIDTETVASALEQSRDNHYHVLVATDDLIADLETKDFELSYQIKHDKKSKGQGVLNILRSKDKLVNQVLRDFKSLDDSKSLDNALSDRELAVLKLVAEGKTNKQVATDLFISTHTVIAHRKNITNKLGIKTVPGLTIYAMVHNIIDPQSIIEP